MNAVQEALTKARARIDTPEKWTRGAFGRDANGAPLWANALDGAVCFCTAGAVHAVAGLGMAAGACFDVLTLAVRERDGGNIVDYNDWDASTHADIMSLFDRAIELAGEG